MNKRTIIIFMVAVIVVILILLAVLIFNLNNHTDIGVAQNTNIIQARQDIEGIGSINMLQTNSSNIKISPNALITFYKYYKDCGHTVKIRDSVENNIVNMSQNEFSALYSDWQINKFTSTEVELFKEFDGSCGEHYLIKSNNGYICIYNIKDDNSLDLLESTDIVVKYLADDDISELEKGVTLYGKENLNAYIENFE